MTAFFSRVAKKNSTEFGLQGSDTTIYLTMAGEASHPKTGKTLPPKPIGGPVMEDQIDRRNGLVTWLKDKNNPALARNFVNRYWGYYFGRGLIHPIDDIRITNPASNPELLDALAVDLIKNNYDIKHLLRTIMNSQVYQLSSESNASSAADGDNIYCTHFRAKRMSAEQLLDAVDFPAEPAKNSPMFLLDSRRSLFPIANSAPASWISSAGPAELQLANANAAKMPT